MTLEFQAQKRTDQLKQALNYQFLEENISQKIYKNLDEKQIWQTATRGLAQILKVNHCQIELYDSHKTTAKVVYEYSTTLSLEQGVVRKTDDFPELYKQLLNMQLVQFGEIIPLFGSQPHQMTRLACPIYKEQDILGNLWLIRPKDKIFQEWEIQLVKQVANQCANAFYQTKFYQQARKQIRELEELNQQKDNFLKAISHELRGHATSIQLAAQTLENLLEGEIGTKKNKVLPKVFNIFQRSCQRQTQLVNDLLTLCHIDSYQKALLPKFIDLSTWIPQLVEPFIERVYIQQQKLKVDIAANIPPLKIDALTLERIVVELINNACKYTPQRETIDISVKKIKDMIHISVSNTGVQIPVSEQKRIFEQFYRLPDNDFWTVGGTGLGLNLVQKLTQVLGGSIQLKSKDKKTTFTLLIPVK
ncbi:MAG: GAF domain-containing sensor histidine kinase [Xenococcaceae cyanobacterium MO_188.B32]|nr:GAF domain-containing sensor histidine kinase [Xenococcaceae cyanobacterium MO_188.B32]